MFARILRLPAVLCLCAVWHASAAVLYVDINSSNPVPPFSSWTTAATNIQDAVDVASNYDEVLVSNGVYQTAGRADDSGLTNRLIITNAITVQSVNGPNVTVIQGDPNEVRCALLTSGGAVLSGFTLTNGATQPVYPYTTILPQTHGGGVNCYASNAVVSNCVITGNSAGNRGGGAYGGTLYNCTLAANTSEDGDGGGAYGSTLISCLIVSNTAAAGGGGYGCTLNNCLVVGNSAGAVGGAFSCNLNNCTLIGNSAGPAVAANAHVIVNNCIMYYNSGGNYVSSRFITLNYCCTTPQPGGLGNITNEPAFVNPSAGNYRLQAGSPCVNAGNNSYVSNAIDLAGNPRISGGTVDIGAYELQFHYVDINSTNPVAPFSSWATAATNIQDAVDAASNYDEVLVTNGVYQYGGRVRVVPGNSGFVDSTTNRLVVTNAVSVQSVNGPAVTIIQGYQVPGTTNGVSAIRCVYLTSNATLIGFTLTNGATKSGYDVPDLLEAGGVECESTNAILSNCVITGNSASVLAGGVLSGTLFNCVISNNSVLGGTPADLSGSGGGACHSTLENCLIIANSSRVNAGGGAIGCSLQNCLVVSNSASTGGGGCFDCQIVNGCVLIGNTAALPSTQQPPGGYGGGANLCTLNNCLIVSNSATGGGGAESSTLNDCTIVANSAMLESGGAGACHLMNCIIFSNTAPTGANYGGSLNFCCTTPLPSGGIGNITNDPLFVNAAAGDFHLQSNSPCINSGNNAYVSTTTDLDGNPRISGGTVDIGAYEFQNPASIISYAWLQQYGLPTDGSADFTDPDHDGMNNWQEWLTGTDPTNPLSVLELLKPAVTNNPPGAIITWQSVNTRNYFLLRATNLSVAPAFQPLATNIPGQTGTTSYTDTNAPAPGPYYYRVGVQTQ